MEFIAIQELDLVINYKPGCTNQKADVLSGSPCQTEGADAHQEEKVALCKDTCNSCIKFNAGYQYNMHAINLSVPTITIYTA